MLEKALDRGALPLDGPTGPARFLSTGMKGEEEIDTKSWEDRTRDQRSEGC